MSEPIPDEVIKQLRAPLPPEAVSQHPTKKYLSSIKVIYMVERLNEVFGLGGWEDNYEIVEATASSQMIVVRGSISIPAYGIVRKAFGGNDNPDRGDAYKGACTDALSKMCSMIYLGMDIYKGQAQEGQQPAESPARRQAKGKEKLKRDSIEGKVSDVKILSDNAVWIELNFNKMPIRSVLEEPSRLLKNSLGCQVGLMGVWQKTKAKNGMPARDYFDVTHVLDVLHPVPDMHYSQLQPNPNSLLTAEEMSPPLDFGEPKGSKRK
jgi:hypothetical protein